MVAQRLLTAAAACAILIFFAAESRKSQCGFGFGSVSVSSICYRPGSVYVRLRVLRVLVGFGSVWCLEHSILIFGFFPGIGKANTDYLPQKIYCFPQEVS
jgi:hypothetical protein